MKTVYTMNTSNDGLMTVACTNIKALFDFLNCISSDIKTVSLHGQNNLKYSYANLVKIIRKAQETNRFTVATVHYDGGEIEINELTLKSN